MIMYQLLFSKEKIKTLCDLSHVSLTCVDEEIARQQRRKCQEILRELSIDALLWVRDEVTRVTGGRAVFQENNVECTPVAHDPITNNPTIPVKKPVVTEHSTTNSKELAYATKKAVNAAAAKLKHLESK